MTHVTRIYADESVAFVWARVRERVREREREREVQRERQRRIET